jgi:monoterpene epsilon-lactone hydrolase
MPSQEMFDKVALLTEGSLPASATWQQRRESYDSLVEVFPAMDDVESTKVVAGGVPGLRFAAADSDPDRAVVYFHGGGYCIGSERSHAMIVTRLVHAAGCPVWFPLYRLAPEHPFPVPAEDCIAFWEGMLNDGADPERTGFAGDSAGGGLVFIVAQQAAERGLRLPSSCVAISPWTDMEGEGTWLAGDPERDAFLKPGELEMFVQGYLGGANRRHPLAAPVFGEFAGLPPFLIQASATELLYDDAIRLAAALERAGNPAELDIVEPGIPHVWHHMVPDVPEALTSIRKAGAFIKQHSS